MFSFSEYGIRNLPHSSSLHITFDDGPDAVTTPQVLDILDRHQVKATFFVVATKAQKEKSLITQLVSQGHTIGNHSLDHSYKKFFRSQDALKNWICESENRIAEILGKPSIGFRPPAGVVTPPLTRVLEDLRIPMYLWAQRFYDTQLTWTTRRALKSLSKTKPGDIVLLHDHQNLNKLPTFLATLNSYIVESHSKGFTFSSIL